MVGPSFTAVTVRTNVSCALKLPSLTVTVTVVVPFAFAAGCILSVQFGYVPPLVIFATGKTVVLLLQNTIPVVLVQLIVLSMSPIVKATLFFAVSSAVV